MKSFVIISDDPDVAKTKPFTRWLAYDIPETVTKLREGNSGTPVLQEPKGVKQGANRIGSVGYTGPKPPVGDPAHHYHFRVFALDIETLDLEPGARRDAVLKAMDPADENVADLGEPATDWPRVRSEVKVFNAAFYKLASRNNWLEVADQSRQ